MGSNSSKPAVPKRKKAKSKYSRVLVKTISNSNIQEVALAVINTQSTIERNRRLSNIPTTSGISPPPRPNAPKPLQIRPLPTPETSSKPQRVHRKRSSSLSEKTNSKNKNFEINFNHLNKSKSLCDNHKLNVLQINNPTHLLNILIGKNSGAERKIQDGCTQMLEVSEPPSDVIIAAANVRPQSAFPENANLESNASDVIAEARSDRRTNGRTVRSVSADPDISINDANISDLIIESSPELVSNNSEIETKHGLLIGNEKSSRDSSGSGRRRGHRVSSASLESNGDAPCDSPESRTESKSDKTDIEDLPDDSNVISANNLSKLDDYSDLGSEERELECSVESTGEGGKMARKAVKSALKWILGSGDSPSEEYRERMEGLSGDYDNNPALFDENWEDSHRFDDVEYADDVTKREIDAMEIDNLESNVSHVNFNGDSEANLGGENAPNSEIIDANDDCDLDRDVKLVKQDADNEDEVREIRENIIERLLNEEGYQVGSENLKLIIQCGKSPESKYSQIDLKQLLICNEKDGATQRSLKSFADGMAKRGMDLLMPENKRNSNFKYVYVGGENCFSVKGSRKYLEKMGYEYQDNDCLKSPQGKEVDRQTVAEMVLDFLLLKEELEEFIFHMHPHQRKMDDILTQEYTEIPEVIPEKEIPIAPIEDLTKRGENEPESEMFSRRQTHATQWLPETKKLVQESLRPPHCDLCGSTAPTVRCEKCANQVFCMSCDDMYHRHPKRRSHFRKAVEHPQLPPPRPPPKYANTMNPPQPPPRRNRKPSASPTLGRKPMEQKPALPRKESTLRGIFNSFRGRPLPPSPTKAPVQSPTFNKNDPWSTTTTVSQLPQQHRGSSLMTDSSSRNSSGSSAAGPNWPVRQTVPDPGLHTMDMSSSDVDDEVTRTCGGGESMRRAQPGFYPDHHFDTLPQGNQQLGRRHTFMEQKDRDTLERGFSGRSSMQHSTSTSDIQAASQFSGPQSGMGYQMQSIPNLCTLPPMMPRYGLVCTCNVPPTQDMHGNLHRNPCPIHGYYYAEPQSPYLDRGSSLQRGFGSGYSLNYMGQMVPINYMPMFAHPQAHMMPTNEPQLSDTGSTSRGRATSPTSSVTSRLRKAKSEAVAVGQQQNTRRRRKYGGPRNHQKNTSSEEDYFSPGGSDDDDFRSIRSSARSPEGRAWLCEHCTFKNVPGTNICGVCCKTSAKPKVAARRMDAKIEQKVRPEPLPRTRMEVAKGKSNGAMNLYDELPATKSVAVDAAVNVEQARERLQGLAVNVEDSSTVTESLDVQSPILQSPQKDVVENVYEQPKESPKGIQAATSPPKQLISKGTSPPPRTISTQTPSATNTVDNWHPLDNVQSTRNPSHSSGVMPRSSSRMSLAGDTSNEFVPPIRRAASIQAGPSGGFGSSVPWSSSGSGYRGGGYRSSGSEQGFSPPMSPRAMSPVPMMSGSRREKHGRQYHQDTHDTRIRGGSSHKDYYLGLEELVERRRHETMKAQGLELVKMLREAEIHNFTADDLQIALHHCNSQNPVRWLEENLRNMTDTVVTLATNYGHDRKDNDIGIVSTSEAKDALRVHKGNVWAAVTECVELRQKKYAELKGRGNFSREEIVAALTSNQGNVELAFADLNKASLKPFLMRIWGPPTGAENEGSPARSTVSPPQPCLVEPVTTVIQTPFKLSKEPEVRNPTEEIETLVYESDVDDLPEDLERLDQFEDAVEEAEEALFNVDMNAMSSTLPVEESVVNAQVVVESVPSEGSGEGGGPGEDVEVVSGVSVPLEVEEVTRVEVVATKVHTSFMTIDVKPPIVMLKSKDEDAAADVDVKVVEVAEEETVTVVTPAATKQQATPTHQLEFERNVRKLLAERKVSSYEKAEIAAKLLELKFNQSQAVEAACECSTVELAISYLQQECEVCFERFPASKMVGMFYCQHRCCRICAEEYFKTQIRNCSVIDILCPFCNPLALSSMDGEDVLSDYFAQLDTWLREVVNEEVHALFQQKLRDWSFVRLGNVKWCAQCKNAYGINAQNQKRLVCPHCNYVICTSCECKWEKQHEGISCELFAEWKKANDPEFQAEGLEKHLAEHGISCPNCNFKYSLAKGGCMHFKCLQCKFEFCSGCGQPFRMGSKCKVSNYCEKLGLHAHHPRNCLFYLRDKEPDALQKLLDDSCVPYDTETAQNDKCLVNVQVETASGLVDGQCGIEVGEKYAGLCRLHYIEYLVDMINRNGIDPIATLDEAELAQELRRHCKEVPDKAPQETDVAYCVRLRQLITEQIPLEDVCTPTQA